MGRGRALDRLGGEEARPPRPPADPGGDGDRPRLGVHGVRSTDVRPSSLRRPAAPARPVQQLELRAGVTLARAAGPADEPRERVDVPPADPPARPRPGARRDERLGRARDARRPCPDRRAAGRVRRLARRSRRPPVAARHDPIHATAQGRRDVRVRRWRLERPGRLPERLAGAPRAHGRERELPRRDRGIVPGGDGLRTRHDRHRGLPQPARHHRAQPARRARPRAQGLRHPRAGEPGRHLDPDARRPLARADRRLGQRDRLPGLAPRHARVRRSQPRPRRSAGRRVLGRGRQRDVAAAQPPALPAPPFDARTRAGTPNSRRSVASPPAAARRSCAIKAT